MPSHQTLRRRRNDLGEDVEFFSICRTSLDSDDAFRRHLAVLADRNYGLAKNSKSVRGQRFTTRDSTISLASGTPLAVLPRLCSTQTVRMAPRAKS